MCASDIPCASRRCPFRIGSSGERSRRSAGETGGHHTIKPPIAWNWLPPTPPAGLVAESRKQMLDFFGDLAGAGDRLGDFGPQNLAEASAQTVDGHLHRSFTRSQPGRYLSVGSRLVFPCQKRFK